MKLPVYNSQGKEDGVLDLPESIFGAPVNKTLLALARRVFLGNRRCAGAKAKTRGEVDGSGKKIWRQKGTGRARHGDRYSNVFVGGGVVFGPTGRENHSLQMSKKTRKLALISALSAYAKDKKIVLVKGLPTLAPKTKILAEVFAKLPLSKKALLVFSGSSEDANLQRAVRNLAQVDFCRADLLNAYQVLVAGQILLAVESLPVLTKILAPVIAKKPLAKAAKTVKIAKPAKAAKVAQVKKIKK